MECDVADKHLAAVPDTYLRDVAPGFGTEQLAQVRGNLHVPQRGGADAADARIVEHPRRPDQIIGLELLDPVEEVGSVLAQDV